MSASPVRTSRPPLRASIALLKSPASRSRKPPQQDPILHEPAGQLSPPQLPFGDALEPGPLEIVGFDAPLGSRPLGAQPLEYAPRDPDHAAVFADLDPELHRPAARHPAGVPRERRWEMTALALSCSLARRNKKQAPRETQGT
jgi:hypothetical protein